MDTPKPKHMNEFRVSGTYSVSRDVTAWDTHACNTGQLNTTKGKRR